MKIYNKLVRDKIPEIIRANGEVPKTRILDEQEYILELIKKLKEETAEFEADHSIEELADIREVVIALREAMNFKSGDLESARRQKGDKNGRFKKRIFLESTE